MIRLWAIRQAVWAICIVTALTFFPGSPVGAVTYYVRASGNDALDGLSPATALASIRLAGGLLRAPGDRVLVGPGVYREGNIRPFGSGTPDAPLTFLADSAGLVTGDPPGPVIIEPPNTVDATTGFIVFGRHDVIIEGFVVDGADDAGIQVRPHSSTGVDSTRITLRGNTLRNGARRGVHIVAAGDVTVTGNTAEGNAIAGLALIGTTGAALRPFAVGNTAERNGIGIAIEEVTGGMVANNVMRSNVQGLGVLESDGITIARNDIVDSRDRALEIARTANVELADNVIERGARIYGAGSITLSRNQFPDSSILDINSDPAAVIRLLENELPFTLIDHGAHLELRGNEGYRVRARFVQTITALDNRFVGVMRLLATGNVEVGRNQADDLEVTGAGALISDNEIALDIRVSAKAGTVTNNRAGREMLIDRPGQSRDDPPDEGGAFLIEGNESGGRLQVGRTSVPVLTGVVQDNVVKGLLRIFARDELVIRRNDTRGIACGVSAPDSRLLLFANSARRSSGPGILVRRVGVGVIENNISSASQGSGLDVRRFANLTVTGNDFLANASGGVLIQLPGSPGDCNGDREVTIDELVTAVGIVLGQRGLIDCAALDVDGDELATLDELIRAVGAALDDLEPDEPDAGATLELRSNLVEDNARFGINLVVVAGAVSALDNCVLGNAGIAFAVQSRGAIGAEVEIIANALGIGSGEGLFLKGTVAARVRSNLIFSNGEAGILLRDAPGTSIVNNLVYANGRDGIAIGRDSVFPTADALIMNNTLYANGDWGVTMGSPGAPSTGVAILNNILDRNRSGGVAADLGSLTGLTIGFNLNNDGYAHGVTPSVTDFAAAPRFVAPEGPDGLLGGEGFEDDDFHLQGGDVGSAAIDAGSATAAALGITGSAVAGLAGDEGIVDLGYHYGADAPSRPEHRRGPGRLAIAE